MCRSGTAFGGPHFESYWGTVTDEEAEEIPRVLHWLLAQVCFPSAKETNLSGWFRNILSEDTSYRSYGRKSLFPDKIPA